MGNRVERWGGGVGENIGGSWQYAWDLGVSVGQKRIKELGE